MAFNPIAPVTDPGKKTKKANTATLNKDQTVTLNDSITLNKEGQDALLRKKYEFDKEAPYLGKYGAAYADKEGFEAKGEQIMDYKDGMISFNKKYNQDDQHRFLDRVRALPENKGKEIYLSGSTNPKYMAPKGYSPKINKTVKPSAVNPIAPIK